MYSNDGTEKGWDRVDVFQGVPFDDIISGNLFCYVKCYKGGLNTPYIFHREPSSANDFAYIKSGFSAFNTIVMVAKLYKKPSIKT